MRYPCNVLEGRHFREQQVRRYHALLEATVENKCSLCGHSLKDNLHGFDQNDGVMQGDRLVHTGTCTYCKFCNPTFRKALEKAERKRHVRPRD